MEASLKSFDTDQMSGGQELMSFVGHLMTSDWHQMSMVTYLMTIGGHLMSIEPDQMSCVEVLKPFDDTLKPNSMKVNGDKFAKNISKGGNR